MVHPWVLPLLLLLLVGCANAQEPADSWTEEVAPAPDDLKGVDATLNHVVSALSSAAPESAKELKTQEEALQKSLRYFKPVFDSVEFHFKDAQSDKAADLQYDTLSAHSECKMVTEASEDCAEKKRVAVLAVAKYTASTGAAETMLAYGMNANYFGQWMAQALGSNPFAKIKLLSNIQVAAWAAQAKEAVEVPTGVAVRAPLDIVREFTPGLCFKGKIQAPEGGCGSDVICSLASGALKKGSLEMKGCLDSEGGTSVEIGLADTSVSSSVKIEYAGLTYAFNPKDVSTQFGAKTQLLVKLGSNWVKFGGELYLKQAGALTLLGLKFSMNGLYAKAFDVNRLNLYDLVLEGEAGVASGAAPVLNKLTIGGGVCLGDAARCKALAGTSLSEEPQVKEIGLIDASAPVAMKGYIGFDADSGDSFFYAALSETTVGGIVEAVAGQKVDMPPWMYQVKIRGYDMVACKEGTRSACSAYLSYATSQQTIDALDPPLIIPGGFNTRGQIDLFGAALKFGLTLSRERFKVELEGPPLKLAGGAVVVQRSKTNAKKGPRIKMKAEFSKKDIFLYMEGYGKVSTAEVTMGEANAVLTVTNTRSIFNLTEMALFGGTLRGDVYVDVNLANPKEMVVEANIDVSEITSALSKLCEDAQKPIEDLRSQVNAGFAKVTAGVDDAEEAVDKAKAACQSATKEVSSQKKKCEFLEQQEASFWSERRDDDLALTQVQLFGRRRRRWFSGITDGAKELKDKATAKANEVKNKAAETATKAKNKATELKDKAAQKVLETKNKAEEKAKELKTKAEEVKQKAVEQAKAAATAACKKTLSAVTATMSKACSGPLDVADQALDTAQAAVDGVQDTVNAAIEKADDAIETLASFELQSVGFKASGISSTISVNVGLKVGGKDQSFAFTYNFEGSSPSKMAESLFNSVFKEGVEVAEKEIKKYLARIG